MFAMITTRHLTTARNTSNLVVLHTRNVHRYPALRPHSEIRIEQIRSVELENKVERGFVELQEKLKQLDDLTLKIDNTQKILQVIEKNQKKGKWGHISIGVVCGIFLVIALDASRTW